ncbi:MAG: hypothetical protein A3A94_03185 [Candidatus Portnoybacteria bacterium RIFCSPLOWO2_01_FULL_43_11]|uniref:Uncharacterized protein n=3 Tax=Candidatus Portnoyibacteriota TaxID=1817913 RepID=A0A1G2FQV0_9BACT|nr:MAG: hypothetical protein A3A94_03185 [Candidatus Portnoybacteria bacterium RIFCSPLOWO2_01_FULL_43_11]OGZ39286.1 MAG: hypothetical protein A3E90_02845 [Candidatus Portnoybacteria bacterium RIFCSPHIGHO2_12_FULL_40_11]OGZ39988.1 MAG: hypothetical protein A3I20_02155 [Candidatus Portnoybacteria bacterium RIFCSPLOWO2_02_FULL_40_15]
MNLFFVGGINGVGKTSIVKKLSKTVPIQELHGTTELMKWLGIAVGDYDTLRKIPENLKEKALEEFFCDLAADHSKRITMVTAHYVKIFNGRITPSYGPWYNYCDALILIISPPESILRRIINDETSEKRTKRSLFGTELATRQKQVKFLENAQLMSVKIMEQAAQVTKIPCFSIENIDGQLLNSVKQLAQIIEKGL